MQRSGDDGRGVHFRNVFFRQSERSQDLFRMLAHFWRRSLGAIICARKPDGRGGRGIGRSVTFGARRLHDGTRGKSLRVLGNIGQRLNRRPGNGVVIKTRRYFLSCVFGKALVDNGNDLFHVLATPFCRDVGPHDQ